MEQEKLRNIIFKIIWFLQLITEVLLVVMVGVVNILPLHFYIAAIILAVLLAAATGFLLFKKSPRPAPKRAQSRRKPRSSVPRRLPAAIFALILIVFSLIGSHAMYKLKQTLDSITGPDDVTTDFSVYVLADDPAQDLGDAADYTFAKTDSRSPESVQAAIAQIESELGQSVIIQEYPSATAMADDLLNGTVNALLLDDAYVEILQELDGYEDFVQRTRVIYNTSVHYEKPVTPTPTPLPKSVTTAPFIVYISGSDTYSNKALTTARSDVNILAVVHPVTKQVLLINTPRDFYIGNPAGNGALDKLTHCGIYGVDCSVDALAQFYGVDIEYYGRINFTGFKTLIDAIGGITVYSDKAFYSNDGYYYNAGENQLDGSKALSFARERYAFADGDNARGENQMKIIKAVIEKMASGSALTRYSQILDSVQGMFVTNFSSDEISKLVKMQLDDMAGWNVVSYSVTGDGGWGETYSAPGYTLYVTIPHEESVQKARDLIELVYAGEIITSADLAD